MPPRSPLHLLWRLFFGRRNAIAEHRAKAVPDPLAEARAVRLDAEQKLDRTEKVLADTRSELWLLHQRRDRSRDNGGEAK